MRREEVERLKGEVMARNRIIVEQEEALNALRAGRKRGKAPAAENDDGR